MNKALRNKPLFKIYYRYKNLYLWKDKTISKLKKNKWDSLKAKLNRNYSGYNKQSKYAGTYTCHYRKLKLERLYYYKFINKQILRKYLVNYKESNFKHYLLLNYLTFEKRIDFNLYKANFVTTLYAARFYIAKGCVFVNKKRVTYTNYLLSANDLVEIDETLYKIVEKSNSGKTLKQHSYYRNIEIDYATYSFIFLGHDNFYITKFINFIKKIDYCNKGSRILSLVTQNSDFSEDNVDLPLNSINNNYNHNNYFKFVEHIYHYYLFFDKQNNFLKFPGAQYLDDYKIILIFKYIKRYYTNYFFRNILLKNMFTAKFNYLSLLQKNNLFNNYYEFENVNKVFNSNLKITPTSTISLNSLHSDFFKYYVNLILKFYSNLLKNYYINQYNFTLLNKITAYSVNSYKFILFINRKIFNLLKIKNSLNRLFLIKKIYNRSINFRKQQIKNIYNKRKLSSNKLTLNKKKYKILKNSRILKQSSTIYGLPNQAYNYALRYLTTKKSRIKIIRRYKNFKKNKEHRVQMIKRLNAAFSNKYYNKIRISTDYKIFTNNVLYNKLNKLCSKRLKRLSKYKSVRYLKFRRHMRFKKSSEPYLKSEFKKLHLTKLPALYAKIVKYKNSPKRNLKLKLRYNLGILQNNNKSIFVLNKFKYSINKKKFCKKNYKLINRFKNKLKKLEKKELSVKTTAYPKFYIAMSLIKLNKRKLQTYNIINKRYTILHKIYFTTQKQLKLTLAESTNNRYRVKLRKLKYSKRNLKKNIKRQRRYLKLNSKSKKINSGLIEKKLISSFIKYKKLKTAVPSNLKKYFMIPCYKQNYMDSYRFFKNSNKYYFLAKNFKAKNNDHKEHVSELTENILEETNNISVKKTNMFYTFNMKLINNQFQFKDNYFFIDLILNLSIRKLNLNYNKLIYKSKQVAIQNFKSYEISKIKFNKNNTKKLSITKNKHSYNAYKYHYTKIIYNSLFKTNFNNTSIQGKIKKYKRKVLKAFVKSLSKKSSILTYYYNYNKFINKQYKYFRKMFINEQEQGKNSNNTRTVNLEFVKFQKRMYVNSIYKTYMYYALNIKKYELIKYIFENYIYKEYDTFIRLLLTTKNCKTYNVNYIKQLYYNLLFTKFFNLTKFDSIFQNNFVYSHNLKIIINYFALIKRFYY